MKKFVLIFSLVFLTISNPIYLIASGTTGFSFLRMGAGSRAQGMGNAFTAMASDIEAMYYNPAGPAFIMRPAVMFYHSKWIEDISVENISFGIPINQIAINGGISYLHLPDIEGFDENENPIGKFRVYDFIGQLGLGYRLGWDISFGFQAKFLQERLDDVVASGFAFDLGMLYKLPVDFLSVGVAVQNVGPKIKYDLQRETLPLTYRVGLAYQLPYNTITFALDGVKTIEEPWMVYPGVEVEFQNSVALRGGYQFNKEFGGGYNVGLGVSLLDRYEFNYVFTPFGILGNTHRGEIIIKLDNFFGNEDRYQYSSNYKRNTSKSLISEEMNKKVKTDSKLPVPIGLRINQNGESLNLSWFPVHLMDASYNIYVDIPGRAKNIKINKSPISNLDYTFNPTVDDLNVTFYVTCVHEGKESSFSKPATCHFRKQR